MRHSSRLSRLERGRGADCPGSFAVRVVRHRRGEPPALADPPRCQLCGNLAALHARQPVALIRIVRPADAKPLNDRGFLLRPLA